MLCYILLVVVIILYYVASCNFIEDVKLVNKFILTEQQLRLI